MVRITLRLLGRMPEYWRRYSDRCINKNVAPPRYVYLRGWVGEDNRDKWLYTSHPIGSQMAQQMNAKPERNLVKSELIEPIAEWKVFVGDRVEVLVGRDKGKQGIISKIIPERNWIFVEGLNIQYQPGIDKAAIPVAAEMPLDISSEVALVDPVTEKPATKVEWRYTEKGERVRVVFPSEVILNRPATADVLADGVEPGTYIENVDKDTTEKMLEEPSYEPALKTFEQDILDSLGIKETRKRGKTYWY